MSENKSRNIFRQEAVNYQRQRWTGRALLISGSSSSVIAVTCFIFILILAGALYFCEYTRRVDVEGEVISIPHSTNVFSSQYGYVNRSFHQAGDVVEKDEPLYIIDVSRSTASGNVSHIAASEINKQIGNLDSIISKLKKNKDAMLENLRKQIDSYEIAYKETEKLNLSARDGMEKMRESLKNYEHYLTKGLITKDQLNYQRSLFQQQQSSYQALNSQKIQQNIQLSQLRSDLLIRAADYDNQISQSESQRSELQRQLAESNAGDQVIIKAPLKGKIESLSVTAGQVVESGSSLAQIKPIENIKYYLVLWLPNNSLPYVKIGDGINIRYEAFPSDKFGQFPGRIESISSVPASPQEMAEYSSGNKRERNAYYKVLASISDTQFSDKGKYLEISSGLQARVIVFLDKKPLYQWAVAPLYDIKNSVVGRVDEGS